MTSTDAPTARFREFSNPSTRESILGPAGVRHSASNPGSEAIEGIVDLRPALRSREMHEAFGGLAAGGKTTARGAPKNPLQLGATVWHYRRENRVTSLSADRGSARSPRLSVSEQRCLCDNERRSDAEIVTVSRCCCTPEAVVLSVPHPSRSTRHAYALPRPVRHCPGGCRVFPLAESGGRALELLEGCPV
jgi:hypothetical protein